MTAGRQLCALHLADGRQEECPGSRCAFWEDGGAVVDAGCTFDRVRVELEGRPGVARWLLGIRSELETARDETEAASTRRSLAAFLPPGLHD